MHYSIHLFFIHQKLYLFKLLVLYIELLLFFLSLQGAIDWRGLRRLSDQDTLLLSRAKLYNILIYCGWLSAIWPSLQHCKDKPHATPTSPPPIPLPPTSPLPKRPPPPTSGGGNYNLLLTAAC